jgi:hypothetical protein
MFPSSCFSLPAGSSPGAIAEVVVFGSSLPAADRARLERKLMRDHGIAFPSAERDSERARQRQAHAMLLERPPGRPWSDPCPLRFLARHPDVSWALTNPVTGEPIHPKRIGVRESAEVSSWED